MEPIAKLTFWLACFSCIAIPIETARILAMIPIPSYSHQIPYRPLWIALSRWHEIVVLTTDPINDPSLTNLTEISLRSNYDLLKGIDFVKSMDLGWIGIVRGHLWRISTLFAENVYKHPKVQEMYAPDSDVKFDVIIAETLKTPSLYALAHRFNAPLIGVISMALHNSNFYHFGAPVLTSHPSIWEMESDTGFNLSLWQRIKTFIRQWYHIYCELNYFYPMHQALAEKYLGKNIPDITDMERNMSVVFENQQETMSFVRPKTANVISYGNFHISKKLATLPKDLQEFLADAPNGFIYISLGTNVMMSSFSENVRNIFYEVLSSLPYKIVWKCDDELTNKPDNIYIAKWFPQQSILAHPKVKLFIYQGGSQSTEEAVYNAVPLIGLPILADQYNIVNKMVSLGVAKYLNIQDLSKEALKASIIEILNDKGYKQRMLNVKALNEDKPHDLLENAIWWIEFVIRHRGAPQLHTSIAHDPWYQKYDMDIIAILSVVIFMTILCALVITYKMLKIIIIRQMKRSIVIGKKVN